MRLLTHRTLLYTPMIVDTTLIFNPDTDFFLKFHPCERPLAMQIGGSNPELLAQAAAKVELYQYDEVDINCGCPSERVNGVRTHQLAPTPPPAWRLCRSLYPRTRLTRSALHGHRTTCSFRSARTTSRPSV